MSPRAEKPVRALALTPRGAVQLACGAALLAAGIAGGWHAPGAAGAALLGACALGLAEVLLARHVGSGAAAKPATARRAGRGASVARSLLPEPEGRTESWVRVDQRGNVVEAVAAPGAERGLYRERSVRTSWRDAFGFWRSTRVEASARELCVPPAVSSELVRRVAGERASRLLDRSPELDVSGVRPYERGDGLRQVSWRQTAHHGELMSFESSGRAAPPVLVVADTLGARDAGALAATCAALIAGLRRAPDVALTDGELLLRTPIQQERFCAALMAEKNADAAGRAREVERLAGRGAERRRVLLVTCDPASPLARALRKGPLGRSLAVVPAERAAAPAPPRERPAEKDLAPAAPSPRLGVRSRRGALAELLAVLICCGLAALALVPLGSMIYEGVWEAPVAALVVAGAAVGSVASALLRWRGVRAGARAVVAVLLTCLPVLAGAALCLGLLAERVGAVPVAGTNPVEFASVWADPVRWLGLVVQTGAEQLASTSAPRDPATWDLLALLAGSGLAAFLSALAASSALAPAIALVPVALSAADQAIMADAAPLGWVWAAVALGLMLTWLAQGPRLRVPRAALVALLVCALGLGGAAIAPSGSFSPWDGSGRSARIESLVDLSRDVRAGSGATVLTYTTSSSAAPLYLRSGVLERFAEGAWTWALAADATAAADLDSPLVAAGTLGMSAGSTALFQTTVVQPAEGAEDAVAVPPGTATIEQAGDGSWSAAGCYVAPITSADQVDELSGVRATLARRGVSGAGSVPEGALDVPYRGVEQSAQNVSEVARAAMEAGIGAESGGFDEQLEVVRWLVGYFTDGSFSYSLDSPASGEGNLEAIDAFLGAKSGYCTHYATSFALLARMLGVPARVAVGYAPGGSAGADGLYTVTMRQLHAWAEVWLDGIGWVGVDVTPASGLVDAPAADEAVEPQEPAQEEPEPTPEETEDEPEATEEPPEDAAEETPAEPQRAPSASAGSPWLAVALACLAAAALGGVVVLLARLRRPRSWQDAWRRVCRSARRAGVRWEKSATEDQIAELVCERLGDKRLSAEVRRISRNACQDRYGEKGVPFDDLPDLRAIARALRA